MPVRLILPNSRDWISHIAVMEMAVSKLVILQPNEKKLIALHYEYNLRKRIFQLVYVVVQHCG